MTEGEIRKIFGNKLVGSKRMVYFVTLVLLKMPDEISEFIARNCWFVSSFEDAWAFTFTGNDLRNMNLIFLSDELLNQTASQIRYTIAHEIGHVTLKHRNSVFEKQTKNEVKVQEKEAHEFALRYI